MMAQDQARNQQSQPSGHAIMNAPAKSDIARRFDRVIAHIDTSLDTCLGTGLDASPEIRDDKALSLETLAGIAAFSVFHFHRQFAAFYGVNVGQYIRLIRMRRAAHMLAFRQDVPVLQIALDAGYEGPESFARAFRQIHGIAPRDFRKSTDWDNWQAPYDGLLTIRRNTMTSPDHTAVSIIDFPETPTACLDHVGPPARIGETIQRFIAWRKIHHLHPSKHATFNIVWCNPDVTPPGDFRMGLCVATTQPLTAEDEKAGLYPLIIPPGRYAKLRHVGSDQTLGDSALALYRDWLPQSGETPGDFPLVFQRVAFFPDVPDHQAVTDILLPLA